MSGIHAVIAFPELCAKDADAQNSCVKYFNPGLSALPEAVQYVPDALPMSAPEAEAWLSQTTAYAEMLGDRGLLRAQAATPQNDGGYKGSSMDIMSELLRMENGTATPAGEDEEAQAARQAQGALLLAALRERQFTELRSLDGGVEDAWKSFDEIVGLEPEDRDEIAHLDADEFAPMRELSPFTDGDAWKAVLEAMLYFVREDDVLLVRDAGVIAALEELGIDFGPCEAELAKKLEDCVFSEGFTLAATRLPGYVLSGRSTLPSKMPWLAAEHVMVVCIPGSPVSPA